MMAPVKVTHAPSERGGWLDFEVEGLDGATIKVRVMGDGYMTMDWVCEGYPTRGANAVLEDIIRDARWYVKPGGEIKA